MTIKTPRPIRQTLAASAFIVLACAAGCTANPGHKTGRVPPGETTKAEMGSGQMYITDLQEASSKVAESLMKDLEQLSQNELKPEGQAFQCTLVYGDIANKTTTMPTTDFEVVRERCRDTLLPSSEFRKYFRVVENRARFEDLRSRELGGADTPAKPGGSRGLNEAYTYFLNGHAFRIDRGSTHAFYINFQLMRASDASIVFSQRYEQTYH